MSCSSTTQSSFLIATAYGLRSFQRRAIAGRIALFLFIGLVLPALLAAQNKTAAGEPALYDRLLCVKLQNDLPVYAENGRLTDRGAGVLAPLATLLDAGVYTKLIDLDEATLDEMRYNAQHFWDEEVRSHPALRPGIMADMNRYFVLHLHPATNKDYIIRQLQACPLVEHVSIMPRPVAPPLPGNYVGNQTYLDNSYGINANQVYSAYNNRGAGVKIVDIEGAFNSNHADLPAVSLVSGTQMYTGFGNDHGTAVLGQLVSKNNGWGTTGIASASTALFAGVNDVSGYFNIANAVARAVTATQPGDVILLEQQIAGPYYVQNSTGNQYGLVPVEYDKAIYDQIKIAVGNKRIVVEAAGNGSQNLDDPQNARGNQNHYPFSAANNSGAIIVGAGCSAPSGSSTARSRLNFSNYGYRVDVQAFGENVWTTGYGHAYNAEGVNYQYTHTFGGTSSASPIVSGACLLVQSMYKSQFSGNTLSGVQMRTLLVNTGKPQQSGQFPVSQKIGPMPNAYAAIQSALAGNACTAPSAAQLSATNITATTARLNCSLTGVQTYDWAYRQVGASTWIDLPATTVNYLDVSGLSANKQYEFSTSVRCNNNTWSSWSAFKTFVTTGSASSTPANDTPCNAVLIPAGSSCWSATGTTASATAGFSDVVCSTVSPRDVWFRCAIPSSGIVTFRTTAGSLTDAVMAVYWSNSNSCSNLNYIVCEDDNSLGNGSQMPVVAISGQPGTMLWVRVWGYNNVAGTFYICALNYNSANFNGGGGIPVYAIDPGQTNNTSSWNDPETSIADRSDSPPPSTSDALFPNPTTGRAQFIYSMPQSGPAHLQVFDPTGRLVQEQTMELPEGTHTTTLDLSAYPAGAYTLRLRMGAAVTVQQLRVVR